MVVDVLFFELRGRRCALAVSAVREVFPVSTSLTPVPLSPPALKGIVPIRGQVVPVLDLGTWFSAAGDSRPDPSFFRSATDKLLLVEAHVANGPPIRAALAVDRVMRLGTIDEQHSRPPPPGPPFVSATALDIEGPALLIDVDRAIEEVRLAIRGGVRA